MQYVISTLIDMCIILSEMGEMQQCLSADIWHLGYPVGYSNGTIIVYSHSLVSSLYTPCAMEFLSMDTKGTIRMGFWRRKLIYYIQIATNFTSKL